MVSYTLITLATAAAVSAQAAYGSSQNQTQVDCYIKYNECRTTRVNGASANMAACAAAYAGCLGFSPFNGDGTNTVTPSYTLPAVSRTSSATTTAPTQSAVGCVASYNKCRQPAPDGTSANQAQCAAENAACKGACQTAYDQCRVTRVDGASANQAFCASQFASCLGENPFVQSSSASAAYTTQIVTAYTTVCPSPTTFTHGPSTYTVSTSTTITLPCPGGCTITTPVAPPATTAPAPPNTQAPPPLTTVTRPSNNAGVPTPAASTTRAVYTGAASPMQVGGSGALLLGALGLFAL